MDLKQKFFLFKQSKYFCAAAWNNLYLETNGNVGTCCVGSTVLGNINTQDLDQILNGKIAKEIRKNLLEDQPHENCKNCYSMDVDQGNWLRSYYNDLHKKSALDLSNNDFQLASVDLRWANTCNFACIYCGPEYSNKIAAERNIPIVASNESQIEKLQEFVMSHQDNINEIYLAGGEPLLMKNNFSFLSEFKNKNVLLRINTNLSNLNEKNPILGAIKEYSNILWTISIDNIGDRFEYTRYGSVWSQFNEHLKIAKNLGKIRFNIVYFIGNALTIKQDVEHLLSLVPDANFTINPVMHKQSISACNLPSMYKTQALNDLQELKNKYHNIFAHSDIQNCCNALIRDSNGSSYQQYFDDIDILHNTNWKNIFPELTT